MIDGGWFSLMILWGLLGMGKMMIVCLLVYEINLEFVFVLVIFIGVVDFWKVFD